MQMPLDEPMCVDSIMLSYSLLTSWLHNASWTRFSCMKEQPCPACSSIFQLGHLEKRFACDIKGLTSTSSSATWNASKTPAVKSSAAGVAPGPLPISGVKQSKTSTGLEARSAAVPATHSLMLRTLSSISVKSERAFRTISAGGLDGVKGAGEPKSTSFMEKLPHRLTFILLKRTSNPVLKAGFNSSQQRPT